MTPHGRDPSAHNSGDCDLNCEFSSGASQLADNVVHAVPTVAKPVLAGTCAAAMRAGSSVHAFGR